LLEAMYFLENTLHSSYYFFYYDYYHYYSHWSQQTFFAGCIYIILLNLEWNYYCYY
jgi:hypothetical protein